MLAGQEKYCKIGDRQLSNSTINAGNYASNTVISAGRLNLDFERTRVVGNDGLVSRYYYPLKDYNASYDSIIMQEDMDTYDDIYEYVNSQDDNLKQAFYTALGRERASTYKSFTDIDYAPSDNTSEGGTVYMGPFHVRIYKQDGTLVYTSGDVDPEGSTKLPIHMSSWIDEGETFVGYTDGSITYSEGEDITLTNSDKKFIIRTEAIKNYYTVTFNKSSDGKEVYKIEDKEEGTEITLPDKDSLNLTNAEKKNFKGYQDENGTTYNPGDSITVNGNMEIKVLTTTPDYEYDLSNHNGTTLPELSGKTTYNGTIKGGSFGSNYLQLDGKDDWIKLGKMDFSNAVTLDVEVSIDEVKSGVENPILCNFDGGGLGLLIDTDGKATMKVNIDGSYCTAKAPNKYTAGTKVRLTGIYDGSYIYLYVNGSLVGKTEKKGTIRNPSRYDLSNYKGTTMAIGANPLGLDSIENGRNNSYNWTTNMKIYTVAIYNSAVIPQN